MTIQTRATVRLAPIGAHHSMSTDIADRNPLDMLDDMLQEAQVRVWQHIHRDRGIHLRRGVGPVHPSTYVGKGQTTQPHAPDEAQILHILGPLDPQDRALARAVLDGERCSETLIRLSGLRAEAVLARLTAIRRALRDGDIRTRRPLPTRYGHGTRARGLTT